VKEKTGAVEGITLRTAVDVSQRQEGVSESAATTPTRIDTVNSEEDVIQVDIYDGIDICLPEVGEGDPTFATTGADDVALDMDTEVGYITEDESSDGSEEDLDDNI
jgi:hypothetical protein